MPNMKGKIIGLVVSVILLVGVAAALVIGVRRANKMDKKAYHEYDPLASSSKAVQAICGPTDFKRICKRSLSQVANNQTATPKDFVQVAINATIDAIRKGIEKSKNISLQASIGIDKMAFDDCIELLQFAIDELEVTFTNIGDTKNEMMSDKENDLKNWLSAAIAYKESCISGIMHEALQEKMVFTLTNASHLTSNVLAIISEITPILNSFGLETNVTLTRRLLGLPTVDKDGYWPSWLSSTDRTLLGESANSNDLKPNVIVAQDGSGDYKSITPALNAYPKNLAGRYVIYVKEGIYNEKILIRKDQVNIFMYGDGPRSTIITGRLSVAGTGTTTYQSATFAVIGTGFIGKSIGIQNTAGPEGHQAVALRVQSDMSAFYNCEIDGYQDTLYIQAHRQFYRNCIISGTIDFIFGDGIAMIQNSVLIVRKPMDGQQNTVTAQGKTDRRETTGIVIQNCRIVPEQALFPFRFNINTFLGRPWKDYSTTVIMESMLADFIQPAGWLPWAGNFGLNTIFYAEFDNRGPGADTSKRVKWKGYHIITNGSEVMRFTTDRFIQGNSWIQSTGIPYIVGLMH